MTDRPNRQILLAERPKGKLEPAHFNAVDSTIGGPAPGEVLVKSILLSIDPANRAWMQGRTYRAQLGEGDVTAIYPGYDEYQTRTSREIPLVLLRSSG